MGDGKCKCLSDLNIALDPCTACISGCTWCREIGTPQTWDQPMAKWCRGSSVARLMPIRVAMQSYFTKNNILYFTWWHVTSKLPSTMRLSWLFFLSLALTASSQSTNNSLLWGPYRSNLYFGLRPRIPQSLMTGLMWFGTQDYQSVASKHCLSVLQLLY